MADPIIPATTVDNLPVTVTNRTDSSVIVDNVSFAVMLNGSGTPECPDDNSILWVPAVIDAGRTCVALTGALPPGTYQVWGRVSASPKFPKFDCGQFRLI